VRALGLAAVLATLGLIPGATAQSSRGAIPDLEQAHRALLEGEYAQVVDWASGLDPQSPDVAAIHGEALIAIGQYTEAESVLRAGAGGAPASEAALQYGLLMQMLGRGNATAVLRRVAASRGSDGPSLAREGRALRALGLMQDANAAYRDAVAIASEDPAVHTGWGELFLDTHNRAEALTSFRAALEAHPEYAPALLGVALALAEDDPPQAIAAATKALEVNEALVRAHLFLAEQSVDAGRRDEARESIHAALEINPSSLEAHSLLAGLAYIEDNQAEFDLEVAKVLAIAPNHGEVFRVAGELAARNYRFDEAAALVRRAIELDPGNPKALADLGVHLLRTGDEPGARQALDEAFEIDGFNVVTFNLLQMMDTLEGFVTVERDGIVLRMHPEEAPVLQERALSLAQEALATLEARYDFDVPPPVLIEVFPKHDDFAVRNVGLPGMIGALGACFGRVVTMDSPRARPPGEFQWEATLWHELAHVVTLQMSKQRLPRWLSEGISVYEETLERSEWGRGMDVDFAVMLGRGETLDLVDLESAFRDPRTISLAYFQASLLVEHLVETYGDEGLHRLLRTYGKGLDSDEALRSALDTSFAELQEGFDDKIEARFGALRRAVDLGNDDILALPLEVVRAAAEKNPGVYPYQMRLGAMLREAGRLDEALEAFERAAELVPMARGSESANAQIAQIALERDDHLRAIEALERLLDADFDNVEAARTLTSVLREQGVTDPDRLAPVYSRIVAIDPFDASAHAELGRLSLALDDAATASREFRAVLALDPVDRAAAHADLAESYLQGGRREEARKETLAALEIAPGYERAQDLLLELVGAGK
jgi:tetratricopeptide (TPR) repeat protein